MTKRKSSRPGTSNQATRPGVGASQLPPPAAADELRRSRPSRGVRTPALVHEPRSRHATESGPNWMKRARRMVCALEAALDKGTLSAAEEGAIERAWAAWELDGVTDATIARVVHLVDRAYAAMHESPQGPTEQALVGCAHILYNGLPRMVRRGANAEQVLAVVKSLRDETQAWPAVVRGTATLMGWDQVALSHAAHAMRVAIAAEREPSS